MKLAWNAFIVAFVLVQLALPLRGLLASKYETRGNFSWNMYSQNYRCAVRYQQERADGSLAEIDIRAGFARRDKASHILHRDVLPSFHAWLCREAAREGWPGVRLRAHLACKLNDEPEAVLVAPGTDPCQASAPWEVP